MTWQHKINIKQHLNSGQTYLQCTSAARGVMLELCKLPMAKTDDILVSIIDEFEFMSRESQEDFSAEGFRDIFNDLLNDLYDWADYQLVWLGM